jgi:hypothetical protein
MALARQGLMSETASLSRNIDQLRGIRGSGIDFFQLGRLERHMPHHAGAAQGSRHLCCSTFGS